MAVRANPPHRGDGEEPVPEVSVVVSTRDRARQLEELLMGLRDQSHPRDRFEVMVVDDASKDGTPELLERTLASGELRLRVIRRDTPGGAAVGREQGWRASHAPLVAFTDDDCIPDPDWLAEGIRACAAHPASIIQGRTEPRPDQRHRMGAFSRTMLVRELDLAFATTNIFYPRSLLERIGGFDTECFDGAVGGEDTDLAWRAIEAGAPVAFCGDSLVYHAINELGPVGKLRVAARWSAVVPYARYPKLRRAHFRYGLFRKPTHLWLLGMLFGFVLPKRLRHLRVALAVPYLRSLYARGKLEGGGPLASPYLALHDLVEVLATLRGSIRCGRILI